MLIFLLGIFIGANISLFLYALILSGSRADKIAEEKVLSHERRKN